MTTVSVAGVGIFPFTRRQVPRGEMAAAAIRDALSTAAAAIDEVDEVFIGCGLGAPSAGSKLAQELGIGRIAVTRIDQACASGSTALRLAYEAVASGRHRLVLVLGIDAMSGGLLELTDAESPADLYSARLSLDLLTVRYGLKAAQYLAEYGVAPEQLAEVAARAKLAATKAPHAAFAGDYTIKDVLESPAVADPLTKLQCCANANGAAAAVVSAAGNERDEIQFVAAAYGSTFPDHAMVPVGGWDNLEQIVSELSQELYRSAAVGPEDIALLQLNDAFSVAGPLYLEALGFAERGEGAKLASSSRTLPSGDLPTNTDGGLLGRGHCLGATGLAMLYELWMQLKGRAGARQVSIEPDLALLQSHGLGGDNLFCLRRYR